MPVPFEFGSDPGDSLFSRCGIRDGSGGANGSTVEVEDALPLDEVTKSEHFKARLGADTDSPSDDILTSFRPFVSYSQSQILWLYRSPLVSPPNGMPSLKDWFGDWNEQNISKKDSDASTAASGARDKRFRRDQEDAADLPPRATFRSTLSQPSQMGNFKHQSIRTSDRERDKDADRDRERDLRDKEGQERLRSLSDKYDRDRLSSPASGTALRTRERDSAPHLVGGTSRLPSQNSLGSGTTRRTDGRDSSRRKAGESSEDWRRGKLHSHLTQTREPHVHMQVVKNVSLRFLRNLSL
jgi:hypothetical protein